MPARSGGSSTAQLNYSIAARDAQFQRVADRVTKRLERLERQGRQSTRQVDRLSGALKRFPGFGSVLGAATAALSIRRLNQQLTESIGRLDRLAKRARNIGIGAEELQLWSQAAKEAGVDVNGFQRGLLQFNRVIAEAAEGTKTYTEIFDRLGVQIRDGRGQLRDTQAIFKDVAAGFGDLSLAAQQLTAEELFSRGGKEARAFLADFQNQVKGVAAEFKGASAESAALAEQLQNMRDRAGSQLTSALDEMLVRMDRWLGVTRALVSAQTALSNIVRSVSSGLTESARTGDQITRFGVVSPGGNIYGGRGRSSVAPGQRESRADRATGGRPIVVVIRDGDGVESATTSRPGRRGQLARTGARFRERRDQISEIETLGFRIGRAMQRREERIEAERIARLERIAGINKRFEEARYAAAAQFADLQQRQDMERVRQAMRVAEEQRRQLERVQQRLGSVISGFITGTGTIGDKLTGLLDRISGSIVDNFANKIAGSLLSGVGGGFLSGLFGFQRGGDVQRGRAILVGEGGPEVFVPPTPGTIIPNHIAASGGGSPTVNLTFNIESTDGPGVRAALREAEPRLTGAALSAVARQQSRPGSVLGRQNRQAP